MELKAIRVMLRHQNLSQIPVQEVKDFQSGLYKMALSFANIVPSHTEVLILCNFFPVVTLCCINNCLCNY